jgi:nicotinamidase-related amidase
VILPKTRASFFAGTAFASILAGLGVDVIVMVGVAPTAAWWPQREREPIAASSLW